MGQQQNVFHFLHITNEEYFGKLGGSEKTSGPREFDFNVITWVICWPTSGGLVVYIWSAGV